MSDRRHVIFPRRLPYRRLERYRSCGELIPSGCSRSPKHLLGLMTTRGKIITTSRRPWPSSPNHETGLSYLGVPLMKYLLEADALLR